MSDIKGERTMDVIADLVEPVMNIAADKEAAALFADRECPEGMEPKDYAVERIKTAVPKLMKHHKNDIISIMAALEGVDIDSYKEKMTLASVAVGIVELFTDEEFVDFFSSSEKAEE